MTDLPVRQTFGRTPQVTPGAIGQGLPARAAKGSSMGFAVPAGGRAGSHQVGRAEATANARDREYRAIQASPSPGARLRIRHL